VKPLIRYTWSHKYCYPGHLNSAKMHFLFKSSRSVNSGLQSLNPKFFPQTQAIRSLLVSFYTKLKKGTFKLHCSIFLWFFSCLSSNSWYLIDCKFWIEEINICNYFFYDNKFCTFPLRVRSSCYKIRHSLS